MADEHVCGFCGQMADHVVEGPNDAYVCVNCLAAARDVIAQMQATYTCSFCLESVPYHTVVAGQNGLFMCAACVDSGIKLLKK
ncbi:MAG TPA: hypothetical protein VHD56_09510 [Tepidisphaeraceae bacterium]|nr:hypothetical protein [Tepidisphaeraceae bacterium]